jgi:hypothetical protein
MKWAKAIACLAGMGRLPMFGRQRHTELFEWVVEKPADWQVRPSGWPETRYEHKARMVYGHEVWYFRFRKI